VFTLDDDPQEWALAKAHVACADAQVHLVCSWYFRTHLAMEPMAVSLKRNMSTMHPVYKLLKPYLRYERTLVHMSGSSQAPFRGIRWVFQGVSDQNDSG